MTKILKTNKIMCLQIYKAIKLLTHYWWNRKWNSHFGKQFSVSQKAKHPPIKPPVRKCQH